MKGMQVIATLIVAMVIIGVGAIIAWWFFNVGTNATKNSPIQVSSASIQPVKVYTNSTEVQLTVSLRNLGTTTVNIFNATITVNGTTYVLSPVKYITSAGATQVKSQGPIPLSPGKSVTIIFDGNISRTLYENITASNVVSVPFVIQTDSQPIPGTAIWVNRP